MKELIRIECADILKLQEINLLFKKLEIYQHKELPETDLYYKALKKVILWPQNEYDKITLNDYRLSFSDISDIDTYRFYYGGKYGFFLEISFYSLIDDAPFSGKELILQLIDLIFGDQYLVDVNKVIGGLREQIKDKKQAYLNHLIKEAYHNSCTPISYLRCGRELFPIYNEAHKGILIETLKE